MKERRGEKIGGGYFVFRRGKKTGRISAGGSLPFEHPSYAAARQEAERLAKANPGERFVVVRELSFSDEGIFQAISFHDDLVRRLMYAPVVRGTAIAGGRRSDLPWTYTDNGEDAFPLVEIVPEGGVGPIAKVFRNGSHSHQENAAFIVRAANHHEDLVASLEETLAVAVRNETGEFADRAQSLLQKIRGEA